jgi:hypothetical protein
VNIDTINLSQPVTSLYLQVTPVNIDPINLSQSVLGLFSREGGGVLIGRSCPLMLQGWAV